MILYHVTPSSNLRSIFKNGLVPAIGERSAALGEQEKAVYAFHSLEAVETALMNWLGDELEDEEICVIEFNHQGAVVQSSVEYEAMITEVILASSFLRVLDENLAVLRDMQKKPLISMPDSSLSI